MINNPLGSNNAKTENYSEILENFRKNFNVLRLGSSTLSPQKIQSTVITNTSHDTTPNHNVIVIGSNNNKYISSLSRSLLSNIGSNKPTSRVISSNGVTVTTNPIKGPKLYTNRSQSSLNSSVSVSSSFPNTITTTTVPLRSPKDSFGSINDTSLMLPSYGSVPSIVNRRHNNNNNTTVTIVNSADHNSQRISVFDPYPMRDIIEHFCEKHIDKIRSYMKEICTKIPLPAKCTIEERRTKKITKLFFTCALHDQHCLYSRTFFMVITRYPRVWIHLMFIALQAQSKRVLSGRDVNVTSLKHCWDMLKYEKQEFLTLVTGTFPCHKDLDLILNELNQVGFFDVFELNENWTKENHNHDFYNWCCCLCLHPERALEFLKGTSQPVIEGQLKEKKGRWKLFRRWRTRYFTLSEGRLSCRGSSGAEIIDVTQIQSVKISRGARNIPKAFEIFTQDNQSLILKPKNGKNAEEWVQCLNIVVAHSQAKEFPIKSNSLPARGFGASRSRLY